MSGILKDDYGHLKVIYIDGDNFVEYIIGKNNNE
jgi:hypothetical protein